MTKRQFTTNRMTIGKWGRFCSYAKSKSSLTDNEALLLVDTMKAVAHMVHPYDITTLKEKDLGNLLATCEEIVRSAKHNIESVHDRMDRISKGMKLFLDWLTECVPFPAVVTIDAHKYRRETTVTTFGTHHQMSQAFQVWLMKVKGLTDRSARDVVSRINLAESLSEMSFINIQEINVPSVLEHCANKMRADNYDEQSIQMRIRRFTNAFSFLKEWNHGK